jgi:hypothetical protein
MNRIFAPGSFCLAAIVLAVPVSASAQTVHSTLSSYQEVPAVSSSGTGSFRARIDETEGAIYWELSYTGLEADATQSHIHFGQAGVNGGVSAFLCTNLGNGPAGTATCPLRSGELSGVISASSVIGPAAQGISPGESLSWSPRFVPAWHTSTFIQRAGLAVRSAASSNELPVG